MSERRFDIGEVKFTEITQEGYLKANPVVTRTGIFLYQNSDGSIRRELRHPDDVFERASLDTLSMIPITNMHPDQGFVNSENSKQLKVGSTGQQIEPDGKFVRVPVVINDDEAVKTVKDGTRELSLGYDTDLVMDPGVYDGEPYDARQTNIRYNHLAIVDFARAGSRAKISLDSKDAIQLTGDISAQKHRRNDMSEKLVQINLDGLSYQGSPEVAKALEAAKTKNDSISKELETEKSEKSALQAKFDTQEEELKKLKKVDVNDLIRKGVSERVKLVESAKSHLDEEEVKKLDSMSDKEIKLAVIAKHTDADMEGKDDVYIDSRFDAYIELGSKKEDGIKDQRQKIKTDSAGKKDDRVDSNAAREKMIENLHNAWKGENK